VTANSLQRVAIYARVSTSNGQQDPEMQLRELGEYAGHRAARFCWQWVSGNVLTRLLEQRESGTGRVLETPDGAIELVPLTR